LGTDRAISAKCRKLRGFMGKKLRISILYNQPVTGEPEQRKYISESGQLKEGPPLRKGAKLAPAKKDLSVQEMIDLSEVGVLEEMEDIKIALNALGYKTAIFNVNSDIDRLYRFLIDDKPDLIFNLVESLENEAIQEMNVAGLYDLLKIPYTGAGPLGLGTALNKPRVKEILTYHGIKTPRFRVFHPTEKIASDPEMNFPMIVKPSREDASVGISDKSVVYSLNELRKQVRFIFEEFEQPALVEEFIDGRELNVALLGNKPPVAMPISEIDFTGLTDDMHHIVSYEAKWMHGTVAYEGTNGVCPAPLPAAQETKMKAIALKCFDLIGCRDYARVDFRLGKDGTPYVLEVNPNPDISDDAGFARSARAYGLTFPGTIARIVELALERSRTP
jgi:D-alanine-D-alanine ligase